MNKNIKRAMDTDTANFDELTYEAYGVGGVGIIINCLSDNKNRAVSEVNTVIKKTGSTVASAGSVLFYDSRLWHVPDNKGHTPRVAIAVRYAPWWLDTSVVMPGSAARRTPSRAA